MLREHSAIFCELIQNADALAMQFYSKGHIPKELRTKIEETLSVAQKNRLLLDALERLVKVNSKKLSEIIEVLNPEPYLEEFVESMKSNCYGMCVNLFLK